MAATGNQVAAAGQMAMATDSHSQQAVIHVFVAGRLGRRKVSRTAIASNAISVVDVGLTRPQYPTPALSNRTTSVLSARTSTRRGSSRRGRGGSAGKALKFAACDRSFRR
jgi:hypothetical protein